VVGRAGIEPWWAGRGSNRGGPGGDRTVVDLTCHNTNHFVLVAGPEIRIRPVAKRQVKVGETR